MLIDHIGIGVSDFNRSKSFYDQALAPLQIAVVMSVGPADGASYQSAGYGKTKDSRHIQAGKPSFWISPAPAPSKVHIAFLAGSRQEVEAFHAAGLAAGGLDNGPPGLRPEYHPGYYGAFILDPDGHNVEAVFHERPE